MHKLVLTPHFKRAFRRFVRHNPRLQIRIENTLKAMENDLSTVQLEMHNLTGKLHGLKACSCGYDCRIIFCLEKYPNEENEVIILLNIGSHNEVY